MTISQLKNFFRGLTASMNEMQPQKTMHFITDMDGGKRSRMTGEIITYQLLLYSMFFGVYSLSNQVHCRQEKLTN